MCVLWLKETQKLQTEKANSKLKICIIKKKSRLHARKIAIGKTKSLPTWKVQSTRADNTCFFNVISDTWKRIKRPEAMLNQLGKGGPLWADPFPGADCWMEWETEPCTFLEQVSWGREQQGKVPELGECLMCPVSRERATSEVKVEARSPQVKPGGSREGLGMTS